MNDSASQRSCDSVLEHRRKLKREQMRRWRAKHPDKAYAAGVRSKINQRKKTLNMKHSGEIPKGVSSP